MILSIMAIPATIVGARTRLSTYMLIEHSFGYVGAKGINLAFAVFLLGWYTVTADLFGRTLFLASAELALLTVPEWVFTLLSILLVTLTAMFGFRAIDRLALLAVPLLLFALLVVVLSLRESPLATILALPGSGMMDFNTGVSAVVGAAIVGVVLTPDLTRYARSTGDCVSASLLGQGGGISIAYLAGMIPVLVWGELEPMRYVFALGLGTIALAVLVFATWTTNVINLYSTALASRASVPAGSYRRAVLLLGLLGTALALADVSHYLIDFLLALGFLVPPVAAVYLLDFFMFRRRDFSPGHLNRRPAVRVTALLVALGTGLLCAWLARLDLALTGISALDSFFLALLAYAVLEQLCLRWRP